LKNRVSWLVGLGLLVLLGGYCAYLFLLHDWRGRFEPEQLVLEVEPRGAGLNVTLRNNCPGAVVVCESPVLAPPFELSLAPVAGGGGLRRKAAAVGESAGQEHRLDPRQDCSWWVSIQQIYPNLPPGDYRLSVAYDPAAAAERKDPIAAELTLGRTEAPPVLIKVGGGN